MLFAVAAGIAWVTIDDYTSRNIVPADVDTEGVGLGGLSVSAARLTIEKSVVEPLLQPLVASFGSQEFTLEPSGSLHIDVDGMLAQAYTPKTRTTVFERIYRKLLDDPIPTEVETLLEVDGDPLSSWVEEVASQIDTPPVSARIELVEDEILMVPSSVGYSTWRARAEKEVTEALLAGQKSMEIPVSEVEPEISEEDLGKTIVISLSERKLYLYQGMKLEKDYGVAIGSPGHSTPRGSWEITAKRYMPSWGNPGSGWAVNMPAYIPPGPSNPLGTRAINLSASGIRIHGTTQDWSIGRAASHGCMRMHRWDVEDLFDRVEIGMAVYIVS